MGKFIVWGTTNHLKLDFWVINGRKRFLWQKYKFDEFCEILLKMSITHQRKSSKLELALALTLGICIHIYSALALAIPAETVEIPGKVDYSHSF